MALSAEAAVFGDGISSNGIEDQRITYGQAEYWAPEFNSVGRLACGGRVKGSAILFKIGHKNGPVILTAAHVLAQEALSDCSFALGASLHRTYPLRAELFAGQEGIETLPLAYEQDWVLVELQPWPQWSRHALGPEQIESEPTAITQRQPTYYFVGFDLVKNQVLLHSGCTAGLASDSSLLAGHKKLIWDNCDSTGGASGGGLFVQDKQGIRLLAFRVGSLFDQSRHEFAPELGAPFELNSHINVSRLLTELLDF